MQLPWSIRLIHETLCAEVFKELKETIPWERRPDAPRHECWMMDHDPKPYTYGGERNARTYQPNPMPPLVKRLAKSTQLILFDYVGNRVPEGCFANFYENEKDHLGWHADHSPMIDHTCPVVSVSFGEKRKIHFRALESADVENKIMELEMDDGSITVMPAGFQHTHQHKIVKGDRKMEGRISLTYRWLV